MNHYYVYILKNPQTDEPFYVGKGSGDRCDDHLKETIEYTENKKKYYKIQSLRKQGLEPIVEKVSNNLSQDEAYQLEETLIKQYGRRGIDDNGVLTNICLSKRPPLFSELSPEQQEDFRKKVGEKSKGRHHSEETKRKISESKKAKAKLNADGPAFTHSEETKRKISNSNKGTNGFPKGGTHSEETKKKISASKKGKTYEEIYGPEVAAQLREKRRQQKRIK